MHPQHCYIFLPGNAPGQRIGIIARGQPGHQISGADQHEWSDAMARQYVGSLNALLWVTPLQEQELRDSASHRRTPMRTIAAIALAILAFVILAVPADALSYAAWTAIVAAFVIGCILVATRKKEGIGS